MLPVKTNNTIVGTLGALWGLGGVLTLLVSATFRLWPIAYDTFSHALTWYHKIALIAIALGMAYVEGYKGFQMAFSPRTAARARYLRNNPRLLHVILAPFFCMGYFHATRRRKITSILLTVVIITVVILVRFLAQPWRGIIDFGVVVGLFWGVVSLLMISIQALGRESFPFSPDIPEEGV